jgi:hypothetical protein
MIVLQETTQSLTTHHGSVPPLGRRLDDELILEALMVPFVVIEVDNPTHIILSGETSVIRGIRASAVPSRYTRCSSNVGSPCVGVVSRRNGMVEA